MSEETINFDLEQEAKIAYGKDEQNEDGSTLF